MSREKLQERLQVPLAEKNGLLQKIYGIEPLILEEIIEEYIDYGKQLKMHIVDCNRIIHQAARKKKNILFEGAQGTL